MSLGTRVVNLRKEHYGVYIGRTGHGFDGYFGNPIQRGRVCIICEAVHSSPGGTLSCFEEYARQRISTDPIYRSRVKALSGRVLGCFCKPRPCHGDILARLADELVDTP